MNNTYNLVLKLKHEPHMYDTIRINTLPSVYHIVYQLTTEVYKYSTIDYIEEEVKDLSDFTKRRKEST